jgi:phosphoglucomutase
LAEKNTSSHEKETSMDSEILRRAEEWTHEPFDEHTRREIAVLIEKKDEKELVDRFYKNLEFGTGGMRGIMGAGMNRMNVYTVGRATQGLADFLISNVEEKNSISVAIAYDSRNNSARFAQTAASVLAANRIKVYIYPQLRPTPLLSFTVRHLGCDAGIVITASHNPREYNGYKVYGSDGGQVISPEDLMIVDHVEKVDMAAGIKRIDFERGREEGLIEVLEGNRVESVYMDLVRDFQQGVEKGLAAYTAGSDRSIKAVFTPLHGTGITLVPDALRGVEGVELLCEPKQSKSDGNFTTTPSPNPEDPVALTRAIELAEKEGADLVLATDPDCDRMGLAVPDASGRFVPITGNQIGCLMAYVIACSYKQSGLMPEKPAIISTIVSTEMVHEIAAEFGITVWEVLTGFKFIAMLQRDFENNGTGDFIYGFEESYGYLAGSFVRDKDGVIGCLLALLMVKYAISQHGSVLNMLHGLYKTYGLFQEYQRSFVLKGAEGAEEIQKLMKELRSSPPELIGDERVTCIKDYLMQKAYYPLDGKVEPLADLPESNVLQFITSSIKVSARPSGTEPKIKFYFSLKAPAPEDVESGIRSVKNRFERVSEEFFSQIGLSS